MVSTALLILPTVSVQASFLREAHLTRRKSFNVSLRALPDLSFISVLRLLSRTSIASGAGLFLLGRLLTCSLST